METKTIELKELVSRVKVLHFSNKYNDIYELLSKNALNYEIKTDSSTTQTITDLIRNVKPLNNSNYRAYYSIINYTEDKPKRTIHNLKKLITHIYNMINKAHVLTKDQIIKNLKEEKLVLMNRLSKIESLRETKITSELRANIDTALVLTNLTNVYDIDILSSMKQKNKENDLIITRTYQFTMFAAGLLEKGLTLPRYSIIYAKGGDGATRFVRLLQGASDLIKASKELWSKKRITLAVVNSNGKTLRMNVDDEASQIIEEGVKQTLTTLINQGKTKSNSQVITSVLGALLRAGYGLKESISKMDLLLDTEKTKTITNELALKSISLMLDGRIDKWNKLHLCPIYSEEEITEEILTLVGVGKGNKNKKCNGKKFHKLFEVLAQCPDCEFIKTI